MNLNLRASRVEKEGILPDLRKVVHVVAHCHKQIKEQLAATLHLHLHGSTSLEGLATANNESQVMSTQARVGVRSVLVRIPSRSQDHIGSNSNLKPLLTESNTLQVFKAVFLSRAVYYRIPKHDVSHSRVKDGRLTRSIATAFMVILGVLEVPRVPTSAMQQTWVIVTFVQEL